MDEMPPDVAAAFAAFPPAIRERLMAVRQLIFETAAATPGVGALTETLKWGEPAYLTTASKSGSTIRLGWKPAAPGRYAVYVDCKTTLVETFRTLAGDQLTFEGARAILFEAAAPPPGILSACLARALTYHLSKRRRLVSSRQH